MYSNPNQAGYGSGYPPNQGYPPNPGFPPNPGYPQPGGYPQGPPPAAGFYPPGQQGGYAPPNASGGYPPPQGPPYGTSNLGEDEEVKGYEFSDQTIRRAFIRKVYSILMCQLLVTVGFIAVVMYHIPTQRYIRSHPALFWVALVVMVVTLIAMACCTNVRRKAPMNFIFLFLFTVAESFLLAMAASTYSKEEVIFAVGITAAVCFGLTIFAMQTRWDFTMMGGMMFVLVLVLMLFGIFAVIFQNKILTLVYASAGALIFSMYLVYDTQLMLGGKHKYSLSPEEYIFAALNLYLDIINIFMYILTIIGASK